MSNNEFTFAISLSVLNHLGRHLYRSFATVLGEAISNAWDADAENVWIYIDRENNSFVIKDDGCGMTSEDFQSKFLKIGYTKRKDGGKTSPKGRPYIGRKGIGKLALLSCAEKVHVISKTENSEYIGGVIDNSGLDEAITKDLTPDKYKLVGYDSSVFEPYLDGHEKGTIIYFEGTNDRIRNSLRYLKKLIALYFRFSLLDESFNIIIDGERVTLDDLKDLAEKTEFLWRINDLIDPYVSDKLTMLKEAIKDITMPLNVKGFIASVSKPRDLKVISTDERVSIDLFVNGRLREKDILKHIPTARLAENYFYGQIHFNDMDDEDDRFTTSREGIKADDPKFKGFLDELKRVISVILEDWDTWRRKHKKTGDAENENVPPKERASHDLYNAVTVEYEPKEGSENKRQVDGWVDELSADAAFNFGSYAECFVSENLLRKYIQVNGIQLSPEADKQVEKWKNTEKVRKGKGNISIDIRKDADDSNYLTMDELAYLVDKRDPIKEACLARDANEYNPIRDGIAHTALLTDAAKSKLTSVYENIKARIKHLLSGNKPPTAT